MECEEWYSVHTLCQTAGYLVGTVGWCISMLLGTSSKHSSSKTHRTLTIIAFTLLSLQMVSILVRTKKEGYIKWWSRGHKILGRRATSDTWRSPRGLVA
ncbi:cytochrome b561 and DOMON domain-containing protein At5g35735-like isoform X2 [Prosopis cineraria]|uniref:cytochrome b561 and DOMON domain-containing protein At5g35735-like isoform X2 n=1 Tax=Prosopis cineraria TaxID=364024 RepID=UPI0024103BBD|nr:cytochrome b561 and DOMON domain-containing protein At5g35735-like isoform X2 [Prosopis cineraria]